MVENGPYLDTRVGSADQTMGGHDSLEPPLEGARTVVMHRKGIIMSFDAKKVLNICNRCVSTAKFGSRKASTEQCRRCRRTQLRCQTLGHVFIAVEVHSLFYGTVVRRQIRL